MRVATIVLLALGCGETNSPSADSNAGGSGAATAAGTGGISGTGGAGGTSGKGANTGGTSGWSGGSTGGTSGGSAGDAGTAGSSAATGGEAGDSGGASAGGGTGGTAGASASGGMGGGNAGAGGAVIPGDCTWSIEAAPSSAIPTVGVVDWSTDLPGLTEARVEFTLNDADAGVINTGSGGPISLEGTTHRALLLGLKPERTYTYRIVVTAGSTACTSADRMFSTGEGPATAPIFTRTATNPAAQARGFIITTATADGVPTMTYVIDSDGDVVWWAVPPTGTYRALMSWEGTDMVMAASNLNNNGSGALRRVSMDGMDVEDIVNGLSEFHHDFTVLPGGIVAGPIWTEGGAAGLEYKASEIIERSPDGSLRTVIRLDEDAYPSLAMMYQTNSIAYQAADETYTVGDTFNSNYLKFSREGELLWQFGGDCDDAVAPKCAEPGVVVRNGGHHLLPNGNLLFFSHDDFTTIDPAVFEYALTETDTTLTATPFWDYVPLDIEDPYQGDVRRLPNGNTLVATFDAGLIREVTPEKTIAQALSTNIVRNVDFRETLYGPPLP